MVLDIPTVMLNSNQPQWDSRHPIGKEPSPAWTLQADVRPRVEHLEFSREVLSEKVRDPKRPNAGDALKLAHVLPLEVQLEAFCDVSARQEFTSSDYQS